MFTYLDTGETIEEDLCPRCDLGLGKEIKFKNGSSISVGAFNNNGIKSPYFQTNANASSTLSLKILDYVMSDTNVFKMLPKSPFVMTTGNETIKTFEEMFKPSKEDDDKT